MRTFFLLFIGVIFQSQSMFAAPTATTLKAVPGENYLAELPGLIKSAKNSVTILHFNFFTETGETRKLASLLKSRKRQNPSLQVNIVLEGEKDAGKDDGAATRNNLTKKFFEGSGINVSFISGLKKEGVKPGVTHAKAVVVDDVLLTGSTNLTNTSVTKNNEFNILINEPKAANFARLYIQSLQTKSSVLYPTSLELEHAKVLTDDTFLPEALKIIDEATAGDTLNIATYFFRVDGEGDQDAVKILSALTQAKGRGVKIKLYLERNNNPKVNPDITNANIHVANKLFDAGIDVYLDAEEKISHAKMILLDGKKKILLQGSTNLYRGDMNENHQINIRLDDPAIVAKAQAWLTAKIAYESTYFGAITAGGKPLPKMFRLWFGYAQNRSDLTSLITGVNQKLVPATTQYAKGRGLEAYLPALLKSDSSHLELPDEVAVIAYKTGDMYDAARFTPPYGPQYGPLHFSEGLFAREVTGGFKSGSAVAKPFEKTSFKVDKGLSAYQINAELVDWQSGATTLHVLKNPSGNNFEQTALKTITSIQDQMGRIIDSTLVALDSDNNTLLVWVHQNQAQSGSEFTPNSAEVIKTIKYQTQQDGSTKFGVDQGVAVRFDSNMLIPTDLMKPILESM